MFEVHIIEMATGVVVKRLTYATKRLAEKAEIGVLNRIDISEFTTEIVEI